MPVASSTGGLQTQIVYPQTMASPIDQITYYTAAHEEHEESLSDLEETLTSYERQIASAKTQEEKMRLKEVQRRVEEERKALCEEMHRDRLYIAAGANEIATQLLPVMPIAGPLLSTLLKGVNTGIYLNLGDDGQAMIWGTSTSLDVVTLALATAFGYGSYRLDKASAEAAVSNSAKVGTANSSWYNSDGSINYPPNNGAVAGTEKVITLKPGDAVGRYGNIGEKSNFVTQTGVDANQLSLPPNTSPSIYQEFVVMKEIPGTIKSEVAPWGGSPGGGIQYQLPMTIRQLIEEGYIVPQ